MKNTVLCYIEKDGKYLMLNRNKKENDCNGGKWIGVGGKSEENESPPEALLREVQEETSLVLNNYRLRGIITCVSDTWEGEYMFLNTSSSFDGTVCECDEGELHWVEKERVLELPLWEGDRVFLKYLNEDRDFFNLKLVYEGDTLIECKNE